MTEEFRIIMVTDQLRRQFGLRIKELRKNKNGLKKNWQINLMCVSRN